VLLILEISSLVSQPIGKTEFNRNSDLNTPNTFAKNAKYPEKLGP